MCQRHMYIVNRRLRSGSDGRRTQLTTHRRVPEVRVSHQPHPTTTHIATARRQQQATMCRRHMYIGNRRLRSGSDGRRTQLSSPHRVPEVRISHQQKRFSQLPCVAVGRTTYYIMLYYLLFAIHGMLSGKQSILHQRHYSHRTHATRHRSDVRAMRSHMFKVHIAVQLKSTLRLS